MQSIFTCLKSATPCQQKYNVNQQVLKHWHSEFPNLVSHSRFVEYIPPFLVPLSWFCVLVVWANSPASLSLTRQHWQSAATRPFAVTKSLPVWLLVEKSPPAGSLASNCIWWSTSAMNLANRAVRSIRLLLTPFRSAFGPGCFP